VTEIKIKQTKYFF